MSQLVPINKLMFPDNARGLTQEKTVGGESYRLFLFDHDGKTLGVWAPTELLNAHSKKAPQHVPVAGVCLHEGRRYCAEHAVAVAQSSCPEYVEKCPNCGCWFGVN